MKRATAGLAVLTAVITGAAVMAVFTVTKESREVVGVAVVTTSPTDTTAPPTVPATTPPTVAPTETPAESASTPSSPDPKPEEVARLVQQAVQQKVSSAKVGMEVYDRRDGKVLTSLNSGQSFASMSVVKLLIAIDVLARGHWALPDSATQNQITRMLSTSDDDLASALWVDGGFGSIVTRDVKLMGLSATKPPDDPGRWGDTQITAQDMVTVYRYLMDQVPSSARDLLYNALYHASRTAADGTDQFFGIPDGLPSTTWAIKQGWGSSGSSACYNTTGLLGKDSRYVVIVLTSAPEAYYRSLDDALTAGTAQLASLVAA
ncbi:hypothetical protein ORV05_07160 [Amycolatopsis cynarae]|uniref:Serine hydrolase n=1 Tax=Amycolatopsis cynarae TaxID=2995223 RepID=A0ABY7B8I7_9PSEU|nr:hypothetical protein [Amycolatopsis sp. HUAS 11-8]WAL67552.1 hypothetical protein ORV05_07160 [Amycolatopsis sp. HUAS 11-8]